jgi:hypothetical protein
LVTAPLLTLCDTLINQFRERPLVALRFLTSTRFTFSDIRASVTIRAHI